MIDSIIIEDKNKSYKKIETNSLIALCEIGDDYCKFCDELEALIESKKNECLIYTVYRIMQGHFTIGHGKIKQFVKKYQNVIEIMKKHYCLANMTLLKYDYNGKPKNDSTEKYFYRYISEHKNDVDLIREVVLKIKSLGFGEIIFGENMDFTGIEYELGTFYGSFKFMENIEIIPAYSSDPIKYKTNDSCYRMTISRTGCGKYMDVSSYGRKIELNSLIFNPDRLPNEITKESTIQVISQQANERKDGYQIIRYLVDMSVSIDDLMKNFICTQKVIENIDNVKNKDELKQILQNISKKIEELKFASLEYEKVAIDSSEKIDEKKIETEKQLYLKRREWSKYDLD